LNLAFGFNSFTFNYSLYFQVILAGDIGDGKKFVLEQSFPVRWTLCDNAWHRIEVHHRDSTLTLQVDSYQQNHTVVDDSQYLEMRIAAPLYVGGLAGKSPHSDTIGHSHDTRAMLVAYTQLLVSENAVSRTLGTRENFRGCIKNLMIGGERRDWADMPTLHHVLLGSCPTVPEEQESTSET